jgi:hypothetical protein
VLEKIPSGSQVMIIDYRTVPWSQETSHVAGLATVYRHPVVCRGVQMRSQQGFAGRPRHLAAAREFTQALERTLLNLIPRPSPDPGEFSYDNSGPSRTGPVA